MSRSEPSDFDIPQSDQTPHSERTSSNNRRDDEDMERTGHDNTFSPHDQDKRYIDDFPLAVYPQNFDDGGKYHNRRYMRNIPNFRLMTRRDYQEKIAAS